MRYVSALLLSCIGTREIIVKAVTLTQTGRNPIDETEWASCLREDRMSKSYRERLETDRVFAKALHQSHTR